MQIERWFEWLGVSGAVRSFWQAHGLCGDWRVEDPAAVHGVGLVRAAAAGELAGAVSPTPDRECAA